MTWSIRLGGGEEWGMGHGTREPASDGEWHTFCMDADGDRGRVPTVPERDHRGPPPHNPNLFFFAIGCLYFFDLPYGQVKPKTFSPKVVPVARPKGCS